MRNTNGDLKSSQHCLLKRNVFGFYEPACRRRTILLHCFDFLFVTQTHCFYHNLLKEFVLREITPNWKKKIEVTLTHFINRNGRYELFKSRALPAQCRWNTIISLEVSILTTHKTSYHQWIQKRLLQCVKPFVYFFVAYEEYIK